MPPNPPYYLIQIRILTGIWVFKSIRKNCFDRNVGEPVGGAQKTACAYLGVRGAGKKSVACVGWCEGARDLLKVRRGGCGRPGAEWGSDFFCARGFSLVTFFVGECVMACEEIRRRGPQQKK